MKNVVRLGMVVAAVSAIVVVLILGCHMGVGTAQSPDRDTPSGESPADPVTGAVVAIPTISPQLVSALNASYEPISGAGVRGGEVSAQALLFAARVELELLQGDEDSEVIAEWFDNDPAGWEPDGTARWERTLEIEPNEPDLAYLLRARVFNDKVSDDVPVVSGMSALFDIVEGETTDVEIIAIPVEPTVHWFLLDLSDRQSQSRYYNVSITARFDVVEKGHVFGGVRGEDNEFAHHMLALLTFDEDTNDIANVYVPLDDTEFTVTEDGLHTTVAFTARVAAQNVAPEAAIAVSSRFAGNRFEISWEPPGTGGGRT